MYGRLERTIGIVRITRIGFAIETMTHLVFATTTTVWIALVMFLAFGMHASMWATTLTSVRQRVVPDHFQGRVASVYMVARTEVSFSAP